MDRKTLEIEELAEILDYDNLISLDDDEDLDRFLKETD